MEKPTFVPVTLDGLHHWLKHEYEHLGWMALCLEKGEPARAYAFALSLDKLEKAIEERKGLDKMHPHIERDLEVLSYKLVKLKSFALKLGISSKLLSKVCANGKTASTLTTESDITMHDSTLMTGGAKKVTKKLYKKTSKTLSKKPSKKPSKKVSKKSSKKTSKKPSKK